jgi:hypothetical protein
MTAEMRWVPLAQARALVELYAVIGDRNYERAALKYLGRYLAAADPSLADVAQLAAMLAERGAVVTADALWRRRGMSRLESSPHAAEEA